MEGNSDMGHPAQGGDCGGTMIILEIWWWYSSQECALVRVICTVKITNFEMDLC